MKLKVASLLCIAAAIVAVEPNKDAWGFWKWSGPLLRSPQQEQEHEEKYQRLRRGLGFFGGDSEEEEQKEQAMLLTSTSKTLIEAVPCEPDHSAAVAFVETYGDLNAGNGACAAEADPDSCSSGCCRFGQFFICDEDNKMAHLPCVCNRNTQNPEDYTVTFTEPDSERSGEVATADYTTATEPPVATEAPIAPATTPPIAESEDDSDASSFKSILEFFGLADDEEDITADNTANSGNATAGGVTSPGLAIASNASGKVVPAVTGNSSSGPGSSPFVVAAGGDSSNTPAVTNGNVPELAPEPEPVVESKSGEGTGNETASDSDHTDTSTGEEEADAYLIDVNDGNSTSTDSEDAETDPEYTDAGFFDSIKGHFNGLIGGEGPDTEKSLEMGGLEDNGSNSTSTDSTDAEPGPKETGTGFFDGIVGKINGLTGSEETEPPVEEPSATEKSFDIVNVIGGVVNKTANVVSSAGKAVVNTGSGAVQGVANATSGAVQGATNMITGEDSANEETKTGIAQALGDAASTAGDTVSNAGKAVGDTVSNAGQTAMDTGTKAVQGATNMVTGENSANDETKAGVLPDNVSNSTKVQEEEQLEDVENELEILEQDLIQVEELLEEEGSK